MMGTRAAAFAGKISNLRESISRIQNGTMPQPTCIDLANMMKYFCQVLHDFRDFKDIENVPLYAHEKRDRMQLIKTLPSFDYCGLYKTLTQLVDILHLIPQSSNGLDTLGSNLLMLFKCLVPFLDQTDMETMPYLVTTLFMSLPPILHKEILDTLCFNLLPFTIDQQQKNMATMLNKSPANRGQQKTNPTKESMHCIVRIETNDQPNMDPSTSKLKRGDSLEDQGIVVDTDNQDNRAREDGSEEGGDEDGEYAMMSVTSILMIAFHYITEPMHHSQLVECLMKLKSNVFEDLLYVIAYGTTRARCPAVEILFRYWPDICPSQQDRKNNSQANKLKHVAWLPTKCQNKNCSFTTLDDDEAVKMCLDFKISITLSGLPPPMLVCLDCVDSIYKQQLATGSSIGSSGGGGQGGADSLQAIDDYSSKFIDLLLPMEQVSKLCENKKCKSSDKSAIGTCFDIECANYNCKKPIRYCKTCFITIHEPCEANNYDVTLQNHIRHSSISLTIMENQDSVNNFVEAIISLLKEAAPADRPSKDSERYLRSLMGPMSQFSNDNKDMNIATEEKQLISQYGIWLMTGLCKSVDKRFISDDLLGRLLGMLFQWFHFTACLPDDQAGSALEKLKGECITGWIMGVKNQRMDVFISCLQPHPVDCSKIGGHWEVWPDTAHQIKEGFKRLLCLVPYDIITDDVWDVIMPSWMDCFRLEVPENELSELKILLSKVFDPELSPLGFATKQMYNFISSRFEDSLNTSQEQTLYWLQIITMLEIPIPIDFLFQMLKSGVKSLAIIRSQELNRIKIANRLAELDKLPGAISSDRSSMSGSQSHSSNLSEDSSSSDDSESGQSCSSAPDDDVILPTVQEHQSQVERSSGSANGNQTDRPVTQQERQAQARAIFSARILQHASMLDAQVNQAKDGSSSSAPVTSTPPQANIQAMKGSQLQPAATTTALHPQATSGTLSPALRAPTHTQPLKSTSGSQSSGGQPTSIVSSTQKNDRAKSHHNHHHHHRRHRHREDSDDNRHKSSADSRPKLKIQLNSAEQYMINRIDNNLVCYILMMDILLKQLELQEINSHRGLDGKEAQQAIELLNTILSTPWIGRHTCCDSLPNNLSSSPTTAQGGPTSASNTSSVSTQKQADHINPASKSALGGVGGASTAGGSPVPPPTSTNVHSFSHCAQGFEHEDSYETCVFCEVISTFHQLAMFLIEFFSPVIEVSICEVSQDAANGEFDGKPDYSRIGLDHLGPSPKGNDVEFTFNAQSLLIQQQQLQYQYQQQQQQQLQDPISPFSPSYLGPVLKPEVLNALSNELQLCYNLLVQFHQHQAPDIVSQLLQMIKLISLHSQVLSKAAKNNPQFISWCQHNMLVNKLWSLCQLESSEIARTCVPLLLHCITLPWGVRLFRDLVERDFNSENYLSRFRAVERVVTIAYFCEPSTIKNSTLLQSTMASAFCYVVRCLDDIEAIVAQRALVSLEMMKTSSLKLLLWCLEVQFDYIIIDRPMILRSVFQLYNHLRDRRFLTWEFFLNRFDTIFLEAQIYLQQTGEIPSFTMQDLKNTNTKSEIYQKKIARAREALLETHHSRSLSRRFKEKRFTSSTQGDDLGQSQYKQSFKMQQKLHQQYSASDLGDRSMSVDKMNTSAGSHHDGGGIADRRRCLSPMRRVMQHGKSISSRYQSIAFLTSQSMVKRKNSKFMINLAMQSVPPLMLPDKLHQHLPNSFVDDGSKLNEIAQENHVFGVVHRICDEDRDTNHSLIFLLMQFFSKPDPSHPSSVKTLNRSHQIVLKHLNILMGYSIARKNFLIAAPNLRLLPVFNAFLTSLPKVLDFNYPLGTILLDTCLPVLIYCPAPEETQFDLLRTPSYSLWLLNPMMRQSWLMSVMAFLYKYQFNQPHLKEHVKMLIWIVINTLESHLNYSMLDIPIDLMNVRDSNAVAAAVAAAAAVAQDNTSSTNDTEHSKVHATGSQDTTTNQVASTTTMLLDHSPAKGTGGHKVEVIEMQSTSKLDDIGRATLGNVKDANGKPVATSTSTGSFRHQQQELGGGGSSSDQQPAAAAAAAAPSFSTSISIKPLIKADTSDSLNVKAKLFQRKADPLSLSKVDKGSKNYSASSSSTRINMEPPNVDSVSIAMKPIASQPTADTSDERLLPIGMRSGGPKTRSAFDLPTAERLLPIGFSPVNKMGDHQQQQQQQSVVIEECEPSKASSSGYIATKATKGDDATKDSIDSRAQANLTTAPTTTAIHTTIHTSISSSTSDSSSAKTAIQMQQPPGTFKSSLFDSNNKENCTTAIDMEPSTSSGGGGGGHLKNNRRKFGASSKQSYADNKQLSRDLDASDTPIASSKSVGTFGGGRKGKANKLTKDYVPKQVSTLQPSFSSPSLLNEQLAQINRHSLVQEFSDKDLSMCLVILETFIHHEPSMAAQMLPNILRLVARYSSSSLDSWQSGSNIHLVGGSMFVARQFIRVALHDLMENNIFHQIFTSHFTGYEFYKSMATALADFTDLNQLAPLCKLFEDLNKQKNLPQAASLMTILENVATYFECIISESSTHSQTTWNNFINQWENFLRKLILALPRYSGSSITTTTSGGRADGTSSMAHPNSSHHHQTATGHHQTSMNQGGAVGGGGSSNAGTAGASGGGSGGAIGSGGNQFLASRSTGGAAAAGQDTANLNAANAIPSSCSMIMAPIMRIILSTSKISHLASCKTIVDPYSKIISYTVLNSQFKYEHLLEISHNCCRLYTRDREKYLIQRTIAYELVQVLKFRFFILEENLLILLLFILQDVGGTLAPKVVHDSLKIDQSTLNQAESYITNVSECLRQYIGDLLEFITDVHAISRINDNLIGSQPSSINRDSFGGHVKAAISQYLALEMSLNNGADNRTVLRYLPWLYTSPSLQQGPREFIECVSHIRQLSWIILSSLQHSTLMKGGHNTANHIMSGSGMAGSQSAGSSSHVNCQPIPIEKNGNIAEHVHVILAGFAEQSKESVLHMSGLFHAFLLCQLWTMYCENICTQHPANSEQYQFCQSTLDDFWAKITPGVLRLVGHSRVMSEMVSTHFLQLIESLIDSNSSILIRYLPMWNSVFYSYKRRNKSGNLAIRLQKCIEWQPPDLNEQGVELSNKRLMNWLEKVQYKMSHIEIQSSQAAPFYLT